MKKSIFLMAALLTIACSLLSLNAKANDGDWVEGNIAQWWWKYVRVGDGSVRYLSPAARVEEIRSDKTGYRKYAVTYVLANNTKSVYKGGESYRVEMQVMEGDPVPWKPSVISRGVTPVLKVGESTRLSAAAYTPEKGSLNTFVALTVE